MCVCQCLSFLGHMVACNMVTPYVCLHMCCVQLWLHSACNPQSDHLNKQVIILPTVLASLIWW